MIYERAKDTWKALGEPSLQTTDKQLIGPAEQRLTVLGQFRCHLSHKGKQSHRQAFCEASGLKESLHQKQVNTHLYCMGEEAEAVLTLTHPSRLVLMISRPEC